MSWKASRALVVGEIHVSFVLMKTKGETTLIALSRDTGGSHLKYAAKKGISYRLVSDQEDLFAKAADSVIEKKMYGKTYYGPSRSVFLLDADGRILDLIEKLDTKNHGEEALAMLAK